MRSFPLLLLAPAVCAWLGGSACSADPNPAPPADDPHSSLDEVGRSYLDPLRTKALALPELIARMRLASDAVVADLGAGPGFVSLPVARSVPAGRVIATDVRADYLAVLERLARIAKIDNITTRVVEPDQTGLEASSVDVALLVQVDHALPDRVAYFRALSRGLRTGGRLVIVNYARYREADVAALASAGFVVTEEWRPSQPFFGMIARVAQKEAHAAR